MPHNRKYARNAKADCSSEMQANQRREQAFQHISYKYEQSHPPAITAQHVRCPGISTALFTNILMPDLLGKNIGKRDRP